MLPRLSLTAFFALATIGAPAAGEEHIGPAAPSPSRSVLPPIPELVPTQAWDATGWTRLGSRVLSAKRTSDLVTLATVDGRFDQLTLVVDRDLDLSGVTVVTAGAHRITRGVQHHFSAMSRTRQIELPGNVRALRSISVSYRLPADTVATLTVFGRDSTTVRADAPTETGRPPESAGAVRLVTEEPRTTGSTPAVSVREGWTLLGAQTVDGTHDADVIRVPKSVIGMFTQVALVVAGGSLDVEDLRLRFAGGESAEINSPFSFRGDERTRVIAVPSAGDGKLIRLIQLRYGTDRGAGKTRVELWAR